MKAQSTPFFIVSQIITLYLFLSQFNDAKTNAPQKADLLSKITMETLVGWLTFLSRDSLSEPLFSVKKKLLAGNKKSLFKMTSGDGELVDLPGCLC
jgi:hypothetical protein